MHKDGKWARQLLSMQLENGSWGGFHGLSQPSGASVTTEQALRRLERLGYTIEDDCIQKAVSYLNDCLTGKQALPDRKEKWPDWQVFTELMLAVWIRRFTLKNAAANRVAVQWAGIIKESFHEGQFDFSRYADAFFHEFGLKPSKLTDVSNFYHLSILPNCLDERTECALVDYVLQKASGIYYVYDKTLSVPPEPFANRNTGRYLAAIELLANFTHARNKLNFVRIWLSKNRNEAGKWDLGKDVNDKVYFPLSDDWRKAGIREDDCTNSIMRLMKALED
jgi:hypothetical protein